MFETNKEGKPLVAAGSASDLLSSLIDKEYVGTYMYDFIYAYHNFKIYFARRKLYRTVFVLARLLDLKCRINESLDELVS